MHTRESRFHFSIVMGIAAVILLGAACAGQTTSRTGAVHDIRVIEGPEPADLTVNIGDEVRWVNARTLPIRVDLLDIEAERVSCGRGFFNLIGRIQDSATIKANESASLCFTKAGVLNYNIRMESALPGGKTIVSGVVRIGNLPK